MEGKNNIFDTSKILKLVLKYYKVFIIIGIISIVFSVLMSIVITPKYKSSIVLFPASSGSVSQSLVAEAPSKNDILKFGEDEEVEQLLQILLSSDIRNRVIEKFDLFTHYGIDKDSKYAYSYVYSRYRSNIHVSKTKYSSIEVEVVDKDPQYAADIANSFIKLSDSVICSIQRERAEKAFAIVKNEYNFQNKKIKNIEDSLKYLGELGVINVEYQIDKYSEQYAIAIVSGNVKGQREIEQKMDSLAKYGSLHLKLTGQLKEEVKRLGVLESKYREARINIDNDLPKVFVVNYAEKSDRSFYPRLLPLLIINGLASLVLSLFFIAFYERRKLTKNKV